MTPYHDRRHAGRVLAAALTGHAAYRDLVVLALPRGGVPVAYEVATALGAPLDVCVVRKLGVPCHAELAMGALASGGVCVLDEELVEGLGIPLRTLRSVIERERRELERRELAYRGERLLLDVAGRSVLLVDDGLATGWTMRAAVAALRQRRPARIGVAVPIAAPNVCQELAAEVDEITCAATPEPFRAVGRWYEDFAATPDEEVRELLEHARLRLGPRPRAGRGADAVPAAPGAAS